MTRERKQTEALRARDADLAELPERERTSGGPATFAATPDRLDALLERAAELGRRAVFDAPRCIDAYRAGLLGSAAVALCGALERLASESPHAARTDVRLYRAARLLGALEAVRLHVGKARPTDRAAWGALEGEVTALLADLDALVTGERERAGQELAAIAAAARARRGVAA